MGKKKNKVTHGGSGGASGSANAAGGGSGPSNRPGAAEQPPLTSSERLVELLTAAVAALERAALVARRDDARDAELRAANAALRPTVAAFERACQVSDSAAAWANAGRVPLPWPSPAVEAALDALGRLIRDGCGPGDAHEAGKAALPVARALAYQSPRRAAVLVQSGALMRALASVMGFRFDVDYMLEAMRASLPILTHASTEPMVAAAAWRGGYDSGASLRALAVACAGAFVGLEAMAALFRCLGGSPGGVASPISADLEAEAGVAFAAALAACGDDERPRLQAAMLQQDGFAGMLDVRIVRAAAAVRQARPGAARLADMPGQGALFAVAALCSARALGVGFDAAFRAVVNPRLLQPPAPAPAVERLLKGRGDELPGSIVGLLAAGARWYGAVALRLAPGGGGGGGGGGSLESLLNGFVLLAIGWWTPAVSALELLAAPASAPGLGERLAPALLGLAEAAQAVAGAPPGPDLAFVTAEQRGNLAALAQAALRLLAYVFCASGRAARAAVAGAPGALAALVRLSVVEPPLLATAGDAGGGGGLAHGAAAERFFSHHCGARLMATEALLRLATRGAQPRIAALLAASPELLSAVGAAVGATPAERLCARGGTEEAVIVANRRALTVGLLSLVVLNAVAVADGAVPWLHRLAGCRAFLAGCDDALRQGRAIAASGVEDEEDEGKEAMWAVRAAGAAKSTLLHLAAMAGGEAREALRAAAAAGPFEEVARALGAFEENAHGRGDETAAAAAAAALEEMLVVAEAGDAAPAEPAP